MVILTLISLFILYRYYHFRKKVTDENLVRKNRSLYLDHFLDGHFSYYHALDENARARFIQRILLLEKHKTFFTPSRIPPENAKVLMLAVWVLLTLGWDETQITRIQGINTGISDNSPETSAEAAPTVQIPFAWDKKLRGYLYEKPIQHQVIKEWAGIMYTYYFKNEPADEPDFDAWEAVAEVQIKHIEASPQEPFALGCDTSSMQTFFVTCILKFFDEPVLFHQHYITLYEATARLMKQDPALKLGA